MVISCPYCRLPHELLRIPLKHIGRPEMLVPIARFQVR